MKDLTANAKSPPIVRWRGLASAFSAPVGMKAYRVLADNRVAAILRGSGRIALCARRLVGGTFVTLAPKRMSDEKRVKQMAADLCRYLRRGSLPGQRRGPPDAQPTPRSAGVRAAASTPRNFGRPTDHVFAPDSD